MLAQNHHHHRYYHRRHLLGVQAALVVVHPRVLEVVQVLLLCVISFLLLEGSLVGRAEQVLSFFAFLVHLDWQLVLRRRLWRHHLLRLPLAVFSAWPVSVVVGQVRSPTTLWRGDDVVLTMLLYWW